MDTSKRLKKVFDSIDITETNDIRIINNEFENILNNPLNYITFNIKKNKEYHYHSYYYSEIVHDVDPKDFKRNDIKYYYHEHRKIPDDVKNIEGKYTLFIVDTPSPLYVKKKSY